MRGGTERVNTTNQPQGRYAIERELVTRMIPELKPGVTASSIREKELLLYEGTGYPPVVPYTGHGVGRVVHEPPYFSGNEQMLN